MALKLNKNPLAPTGFDEYEQSATTHLYTYASDVDLRIFKPDGVPASTPLPFVVLIDLASFIASSSDTGSHTFGGTGVEITEPFTQCGMICALVRTRVHGDLPVEPGSLGRGATTDRARTVDAVSEDAFKAFKYVQANPDRANWTVEPNWGIIAGTSTGGMAAMIATIRHRNDMNPAGLFVVATGLGLDNGFGSVDWTDEIRTELGHDETQLPTDLPTCYYCIDNDDIISTSPNNWQGLLRTEVSGFGGLSVIHRDTTIAPSHHGLGSWVVPGGLTDASTVNEANFNFFSAVCAATPKFSGGFKFA